MGGRQGSDYLLPLMQGLIRLYHSQQVKLLERFLAQGSPGHGRVARPQSESRNVRGIAACESSVPYVTIITDFADYPPHFWMERQDQYIVCGTQRAVDQARSMGYSPDKIFATSG